MCLFSHFTNPLKKSLNFKKKQIQEDKRKKAENTQLYKKKMIETKRSNW